MALRLHHALVLAGALTLGACMGHDEDLDFVEDPEAADVLAPGKADSDYGLRPCERDGLISWLNSCSTTEAVLAAAPYRLSKSARAALVKHRDGPNRQCGPEPRSEGHDDRLFATLVDVDRVEWIGPKVITRLGRTFASRCGGALEARAIFSPRPYAQSHLPALVQLADRARKHLDIAIYSFRDEALLSALQRAVQRQVKVRVLFHKAQAEAASPANSYSARIEALGINVRFVTLTKVLHHKIMIVDGPVQDVAAAASAYLATGSANWTNDAGTSFDENTMIFGGVPALVLAFQHEFNTLWKQSIDFVSQPNLPFEQGIELDPATFPTLATARALFTSANLNASKPSFPRVRPSYVVAEAIAAEIKKAQRSIFIASGHLRSRRVYEALVAAKTARPALDIRIYLDGQEYVGKDYHEDEVAEDQACLQQATSQNQKDDCNDKGRYFGYDAAMLDLNHDGRPDIDLRFKYYAYRWDHGYAPQMHHKYIVIDDDVLISGSYNLSHNSEVDSFENTLVLRREEPAFATLIGQFKANFSAIHDTDPNDTALDGLIQRVKTASTVPLVFAPMALDHGQITDLKALIRTACGKAIDRPPYTDQPAANRSCPRVAP